MQRRNFISAALAGMTGLPLVSGAVIGQTTYQGTDSLNEPARDIPVAGDFDVVVCGAGPAGVAAAIEAGRTGAKTLLLEVHGCLGGVWTSGNLTWILDNKNKSGIVEEIKNELRQRGGSATVPTGNSFSFDAEHMKLLLEEMCLKAGVTIRLFTRLVSTAGKDGRLTHVVTESKSGREAWAGKIFIDCSGDGDLAARAGCGFDYGDSAGQGQPMSMLCLITGVHYQEIKEFIRDEADSKSGSQSKKRLEKAIIQGGHTPSYARPSIHPIFDDLHMLMANHEYGFKGTDAFQVTEATLRGRAEVHKIINSLRSLGGSWKNLRLVSTAEQIGVRESRRIHGLHTVSREDLIKGARYHDAVCRVTFGVDVHSVERSHENTTNYNRGIPSKPYDIPLRALIAKDVKGLMMAGRCISGDFVAHSSYRVTGNAAIMGQAAGRVAAIAAQRSLLPQEVRWTDVNWSVN
ncbi:FAD-dependent oxidoreductase [Ravibacter arvi]|uniref:FAD-dependent oxidoreductase n=1 Tax=Ravibacter arvi TaxID=2051041 RepID=A0ABP8M8P6_9BACT